MDTWTRLKERQDLELEHSGPGTTETEICLQHKTKVRTIRKSQQDGSKETQTNEDMRTRTFSSERGLYPSALAGQHSPIEVTPLKVIVMVSFRDYQRVQET